MLTNWCGLWLCDGMTYDVALALACDGYDA